MTRTSEAGRRLDRSHWLYIAVIVAVVLGALVGSFFPQVGQALEPLGEGFVALIRMMIAPVIFCTIVIGVGSIAKAATVGKVGGIAIGYFLVMSTFALMIGLLVGNILQPGTGLDMAGADYKATGEAVSSTDFVLGIIPTTLFSSLVDGSVLQALLVALLVGFAVQALGERGAPILRAVETLQRLVFRILSMVLWVAPIGAFGAIAAVVGNTGPSALLSLGAFMLGFYLTCALFIVLVLGGLLALAARVNIFLMMRYLAREYLLIVSTSSSEAALPRLIAKMTHAGVGRSTVGIVVPTGYSFNLDGTAIYLTLASLFIATGMGKPMSLGEQIALLAFMILASKGAAGVSGAGLATLAGGLQTFRPDLVSGVGVIVGIDRFMSECRALTNFTGNAVATVVIGVWTRQIDRARLDDVLHGRLPFDEIAFARDDPHSAADAHGGDESVAARTAERPSTEQLNEIVGSEDARR